MDGLVLTAAGASTRSGGADSKVLRSLAGTPVLVRALAPFLEATADLRVVVTARSADLAAIRALVPGARVVEGGASRGASVRRGLEALPRGLDVVLVHDAARPLCSAALVRRVLDAARRDGAAAPLLPVLDSVHRASAGRIGEPVDRRDLWAAQTPQAARQSLFARALAIVEDFEGTDEVTMLVKSGIPVTLVEGERRNLKITVPEDFALAECLLRGLR